ETRRQPVLQTFLDDPKNRRNAVWRVEHALNFVDLFDDAGCTQLRKRIEAISTVPQGDWAIEGDPTSELLARLEAGFRPPADQVPGDDGMTDDTRGALEYWKEKLAAQRLRDSLGPLAESRLDSAIRVDAPELASTSAWMSCTGSRRREVAEVVQVAASTAGYPLELVGIEVFDTRDA